MNTDEHDELWHLLGKARASEISPFFSRNVLRAIREEAPEKTGVFVWLRRHWKLTAVSAGALTITGLALIPRSEPPDSATMLVAKEVSQSTDYQVIENLDELLASEESSVWLEQ